MPSGRCKCGGCVHCSEMQQCGARPVVSRAVGECKPCLVSDKTARTYRPPSVGKVNATTGPLSQQTAYDPMKSAGAWRAMSREDMDEMASRHWQTTAYRKSLTAARRIIWRAFREHPGEVWYVGYSGGKDSLVLAELVDETTLSDDTPLMYRDDEMLLPEHLDYMSAEKGRLGDRLLGTYSGARHKGWFESWRDWPHSQVRWTSADGAMDLPWLDGCGVIGGAQMRALHGWTGQFLGVRKEESQVRGEYMAGSDGFGRNPANPDVLICHPLMDWSWRDVWTYLLTHGLPYCAAYDRYMAIGMPPKSWRLGPVPLSSAETLSRGWPDLYRRLVSRYGARWDVAGYRHY